MATAEKKTTKHTPGPWACDDGNSVTDLRHETGIAILEPIESFWCGEVPRFPRDEESEANARLIAAAPDLLSALKSLATAVAYTNSITGPKGQEILGRALAAIAKAEGKD